MIAFFFFFFSSERAKPWLLVRMVAGCAASQQGFPKRSARAAESIGNSNSWHWKQKLNSAKSVLLRAEPKAAPTGGWGRPVTMNCPGLGDTLQSIPGCIPIALSLSQLSCTTVSTPPATRMGKDGPEPGQPHFPIKRWCKEWGSDVSKATLHQKLSGIICQPRGEKGEQCRNLRRSLRQQGGLHFSADIPCNNRAHPSDKGDEEEREEVRILNSAQRGALSTRQHCLRCSAALKPGSQSRSAKSCKLEAFKWKDLEKQQHS